MTYRDWATAMLLDPDHPELWAERDRDAYLAWRLSTYAAWLRANVPRETLRERRREVRERVDWFRAERAALYKPRYRACSCARCRRPQVSPWFERVFAELETIEKGIRQRSGR